jgi:hypothetical protein
MSLYSLKIILLEIKWIFGNINIRYYERKPEYEIGIRARTTPSQKNASRLRNPQLPLIGMLIVGTNLYAELILVGIIIK